MWSSVFQDKIRGRIAAVTMICRCPEGARARGRSSPKAHPASAHQTVPSLSRHSPSLSRSPRHSSAAYPALLCLCAAVSIGAMDGCWVPHQQHHHHHPVLQSLSVWAAAQLVPAAIPLDTVQPHVLAMATLARDTILASIAG
jgi:hypothetical protein